MTGPSSTPRGERTGRPGMTWETRLEWTGEQLADDDTPTPRPNRATRRAARRAMKEAAVTEYPHQDGNLTVLGPEVFTDPTNGIICWKGENYVRQDERDEERANYLNACKTIAAMHAAAVGEVRGPDRGVVEDVADVRAALEALRAKVDEATAALRRVRALHARTTVQTTGGPADACDSCDLDGMNYPWPCPTAEALAGPRPDATTTDEQRPAGPPTLALLHHACGQVADIPGDVTLHPGRLSWPGHDCPADLPKESRS